MPNITTLDRSIIITGGTSGLGYEQYILTSLGLPRLPLGEESRGPFGAESPKRLAKSYVRRHTLSLSDKRSQTRTDLLGNHVAKLSQSSSYDTAWFSATRLAYLDFDLF